MVYEVDKVLFFVGFVFGFGFEGLQGNWNGGMVVKYWEGEMSLQVGHGWLVAGMEGWLFSQMLGKLSVFLMPRVEGISHLGSCR